ncbi:MAG: sigma-70 family RNA polymerase sigma factor [Polyangiaceae bacterium]|nr:sigma-70 family RNA polymerase sigma factor [Polyangiaceae bacterium]
MDAAFAIDGALLQRFPDLARRLRVSARDVHDLAQAVWLDLHESGRAGAPPPDRATIDRVVTKLAQRDRRAALREIPTSFQGEEELSDDTANPETLAMMKEKADFWRVMLAKVPEDCRVVFVDHEILGLTFEEIAAARGISRSTAHARSRRGLDHLALAVDRWRAEQRRRGRDDTLPLLLPVIPPPQRLARALRASVIHVVTVTAALFTAGAFMMDSQQQGPGPLTERATRQAPASIGVDPRPAPSPLPAPATGSAARVAPSAPRAPSAPSAPGASVQASSRAASDALEEELLQCARGALSIKNEQEARRCLEDHLLKFPAGRRAPERDELLRRSAE